MFPLVHEIIWNFGRSLYKIVGTTVRIFSFRLTLQKKYEYNARRISYPQTSGRPNFQLRGKYCTMFP
jgi:hypothetical protein